MAHLNGDGLVTECALDAAHIFRIKLAYSNEKFNDQEKDFLVRSLPRIKAPFKTLVEDRLRQSSRFSFKQNSKSGLVLDKH